MCQNRLNSHFLRISENNTYEIVILESVKIKSVEVDTHSQNVCLSNPDLILWYRQI